MNIKYYNFWVLLVIILIACNEKKENKETTKIHELSHDFVAVTKGTISAYDPLIFILKNEFPDSLSEEKIQQLVRVKPHVEYRVELINNQLRVIPLDRFEYGNNYQVKILLRDIYPKHYSNNHVIQFSVFNQDIEVKRKGFIIQDDNRISMTLDIYTADKAKEDELKTIFKTDAQNVLVVSMEETKYEAVITWDKGINNNSHLSYDGSMIGSDKQGKINLFTTELKEFSKVHSRFDNSQMQYLFYFNKTLDSDQDLSGIVTVNGLSTENTISNNILTVYLDKFSNQKELLIRIESSLISMTNDQLTSSLEVKVLNEVPKPAVEFADHNNLIPSTGDFKIPIKAKQIKSVRVRLVEIKNKNVKHYLAWHNIQEDALYNLVALGKLVFDEEIELTNLNNEQNEWNYYGIDLKDRFKRNPGSLYNISLSFGPQNTFLYCNEEFKNKTFLHQLPNIESFENGESYVRGQYYRYNENYWKNRNNPCHLAYYRERRPISKNIMCNNVTTIVKKAGKRYHLSALDLMTLNPLINATSKWYDYQGEFVAETKIDANGMADVELNTRPFVVEVIEENGHKNYLNLQQNDVYSYTEFDVSGDNSGKNALFFSYTDREIWRPGDTIFLNVMINKKLSNLPSGLPISVKFYNTQNNLIGSYQIKYNQEQYIYSFSQNTKASDKTGVFSAKIDFGPHTLNKNLRVETIRPNVAELLYEFDNFKGGTVFSSNLTGTMSAQYLNGFPVKNAKVQAKAKFIPIQKPFKKWKDYQFGNFRTPEPYLAKFIETTTNENGHAKIKSLINKNNLKYGVYNMKLETELVLPGGGINKEGKLYTLSPFDQYVGIKSTKGKARRGSFGINEQIEIPIVVVNKKIEQVKENLELNYSIKKHTKYWWIDKYALSRNYHYTNNEFWKVTKNGTINIKKGQGLFEQENLESGSYLLEIVHPNTGHLTSFHFNVFDSYRGIPANNPEHINIDLNKETASPGEKVELTLPPIKDGKALISIEQYDKVLDKYWVNVNTDQNVFEILCGDTWHPNVYINVTLLQTYEQQNNDRPLRMYGVGNLKIDNEKSHLLPIVQYPEKIEPESSFSISVNERKGKSMQYTIALVDEGLLNITAYASPNPFNYFNKKLALLVQSWDIYKHLMNVFKGDYAGIISIGGDDAYQPDLIEDVNRFKPVVKHLGPFYLDANKKNSHEIFIPNYIGKLRVMVVACNENQYGNHEGHIWVKSPIMIQSQWPRSLNISDEVNIPITIFKDLNSIHSANIKTSFNHDFFKGVLKEKKISLNNVNQVTEHLKYKVKNLGGATNVKLSISADGKQMDENVDILVNYPNSKSYSSLKEIVEPGKTILIKPSIKGYKETNRFSMQVSGLNIPDIANYSKSLIGYPYGCLEQTTSKAFSQLVLHKILKLTTDSERERKTHLEAAFLKLQRLQNANGSFRYWPNGYYNSWSDLYVGNFLISASKFRYNLPSMDILKKWKSFHTKKVNAWNTGELSTEYLTEREYFYQSYRLYLLAKMGSPTRSAMNRFSKKEIKSPQSLWLLAGTYQLAGFSDRAKTYIEKAEAAMKSKYRTYHHGFGDHIRDLALIVEILSHFPDQKKKRDFYYNSMVDESNDKSWLSTQTKAYVLFATAKYFEGVNINIGDPLVFNLTKGSIISNHELPTDGIYSENIKTEILDQEQEIKINNNSKKAIYITQNHEFISSELYQNASNNHLSLKTGYFNTTKKCKMNDCKVNLGDDIAITIKVTNNTTLKQENLALNLKMPSGFELINPRLYETIKANDKVEYEDFRDDRVYSFFGLNAGETKVFFFKSKAILQGDFLLPAIKCEHMYKGEFYAISKASRIKIE